MLVVTLHGVDQHGNQRPVHLGPSLVPGPEDNGDGLIDIPETPKLLFDGGVHAFVPTGLGTARLPLVGCHGRDGLIPLGQETGKPAFHVHRHREV